VLHDGDAFDHFVAVDAGHHDVGAGSLVQINVLTQRLRLALIERLAFHRLIVAVSIVGLHLRVTQCHWTSERLVLALELHGLELLLNLLLDTHKPRLTALHGALARLLCKLVQADLMEALLALFALPGLDEDGRAEGAEELARHLVLPNHIFIIESETHSFKVISCLALSIGA
jgi:hypothetical protein